MKKELKKAIIDWLFENENEWQRRTACNKEFKPYIFHPTTGDYLIGGFEVSEFITKADELIYGSKKL